MVDDPVYAMDLLAEFCANMLFKCNSLQASITKEAEKMRQDFKSVFDVSSLEKLLISFRTINAYATEDFQESYFLTRLIPIYDEVSAMKGKKLFSPS